MNIEPKWLEEPKPHNYPAASSYLNLTFTDSECDRLVKALKSAPIILESKTMNMSLKEKYPFEGTSIFSYQREYKIEMLRESFIVEYPVKE